MTPEQARRELQGRPACWVTGDFDPLLAEHVRRLRQSATAGQVLVVQVRDGASALLSQRARAELVAALGIVDYVVMVDSQPSEPPAPDREVTEQFIEHVLSRHRKETTG